MTTGSPAARRQLGGLLRQLREESGKTVQAVGEAKIAGATKVWRIESGKTLPSINDVLGLCWLYGADQPTTQRLTDMVVELSQSNGGWWEEYGAQVPQWLSLNVGMEQTAARVCAYQPELVHGLVQTPAYARAANLPEDDAQRNAETRLARQRAVAARTDPFSLAVVLGQAALERLVGGPDVLEEQRRHLVDLDDQRVQVRVLTWEVGMHGAHGGPFTLFEFAAEEPVVYVPLLSGGRYIEREGQVQAYRAAFSSIWGRATPIEEFMR